ncbi:MAG: FecCD family ABC transporter permease [Spirochaetales bacterium]
MNSPRPVERPNIGRHSVMVFSGLFATFATVVVLSLRIGSIPVSFEDVLASLLAYDPGSYEQTVIRGLRVPRTVIGIGVGAALASAGAAMQASTRNPLAGPAILGVNSGAAFGVVTAVFFLGITQTWGFVWFAFAGGLIASTVVYAIGSVGPGGASPVKLALAGVVVSSLLSSWTNALVLLDEQTLDVMRFWNAGSLTGRSFDVFMTVTPFLGTGIAAMLLLSHQLNILSLDEETARALGMNTTRVRAIISLIVVVLAGASVAATGPIGFVGLAVPHMVRKLAGPDYRWVMPVSLVVGPTLLLGTDIIGRVIARPSEIQVGIITALVGAPFLIVLARRRRAAQL